MLFKILYFDEAGNPINSRDLAPGFCALEVDGQMLDFFVNEDACLEAIALLQYRRINRPQPIYRNLVIVWAAALICVLQAVLV